MIIADAASALLVVLARRLHTSGGGNGLLSALTGLVLLTRLPTRPHCPTVVFTVFGRRGQADLVHASITPQAALAC